MSSKRVHQVILLGHKAGVGKDTLAHLICDQMARKAKVEGISNEIGGARIFHFADRLKDVCMDLYSLSHEQVNTSQKNCIDHRWGLTPRQILQAVGKSQREIYPDIWAKHVTMGVDFDIKFVDDIIPNNKFRRCYVVPDFRFPNEYAHLKNWAYKRGDIDLKCYRIDRNRDENFLGSRDVSETALDDFRFWDGVVENNGYPGDMISTFCLINNFVCSQD